MPTCTARAAACVFAFFALFPTMAHAGEFSVTDEKADTEISEVSRIYLDGQLVSTIKLNDMNRAKTVRVPTPTGRTEHSYTLCGEITIRTPEGRVETHEVSSDGVLHSPDGHHFFALGSNGFTDFYLLDPDSPETAEHRPGQSDSCAAPIS
ncbi:MAG: hypothetical protein ABF888_02585 [Acetobacter papayae]